jgi:mannose-6-phosphate isomerase-like protein (cupin superfamily)
MHYKRAEHWVVVSGVATAINGEDVLILTEGESTYIPVGTTHSLENKTNERLEIIEVQSGTYLGEDDIVRFEDIYGRVKD